MKLKVKRRALKFLVIVIVLIIIAVIFFINSNNKKMVNEAVIEEDSAGDLKNVQNDMAGMHHMHVTSEKDFLYQMIPHHQEAVDTSKYIIDNSNNSELKSFAEKVITAQTSEISQMEQWYKDWYNEDYSVNKAYVPMMGDLTILEGKALDKAYITGMIGHHEGAIQMAQQVKAISERKEILELADNIIRTQSEEVDYLNELID